MPNFITKLCDNFRRSNISQEMKDKNDNDLFEIILTKYPRFLKNDEVDTLVSHPELSKHLYKKPGTVRYLIETKPDILLYVALDTNYHKDNAELSKFLFLKLIKDTEIFDILKKQYFHKDGLTAVQLLELFSNNKPVFGAYIYFLLKEQKVEGDMLNKILQLIEENHEVVINTLRGAKEDLAVHLTTLFKENVKVGQSIDSLAQSLGINPQLRKKLDERRARAEAGGPSTIDERLFSSAKKGSGLKKPDAGASSELAAKLSERRKPLK